MSVAVYGAALFHQSANTESGAGLNETDPAQCKFWTVSGGSCSRLGVRRATQRATGRGFLPVHRCLQPACSGKGFRVMVAIQHLLDVVVVDPPPVADVVVASGSGTRHWPAATAALRRERRNSTGYRHPPVPHRAGHTAPTVWPCHVDAGRVGWRNSQIVQGKAWGWKTRIGGRRNAARVVEKRSNRGSGARRTAPKMERLNREGRSGGLVEGAVSSGWRSAVQIDARRRTHCSKGQVGATRNDGFGAGARRSSARVKVPG